MNILVIRFTSLGDLVTLEPAFRAIRRFFPDAKITFVTSGMGKGLYADSGYFDEVVVFGGNYGLIWKTLWHQRYDLTFNLQCNRPSHILMMGLKSDRILNSSSAWWQKFLGLRGKTKWPPELLRLAGIDEARITEFFGSEELSAIHLPFRSDSAAVDAVRSAYPDRKIVAVAPGASERWESKKWGDRRYSDLVKKLMEAQIGVVLVGSAAERDSGQLIEAENPGVVNLIEKTSLSELKGVLAACDILVGNDSGPAHLAAGVGTDTITIFGSTDIKHCVKMMPYRGRHEYLVAEPRLECQPCYKSKCPTQHECMAAIGVEDVFRMIEKSVAGAAQQGK